MHLRTLKDAVLKNKRVLLRLELNVPINKGKVVDATRIKEAIPTIRDIISKKPRQLIIIAHLGRPEGKWEQKYSLRPVARKVQELLGKHVVFIDDNITKDITSSSSPIILLENLRFYKGEEANDKTFAKRLASLANVFVNDAFGAMHRKHASTYAVAKILPSYAGLLVEKEVLALSRLLNPKRPYIAIIGGGKADKLSLIKGLTKKADQVLVGGASANHLLASKGYHLGKTLLEPSLVKEAKSLLKNKRIILPLDIAVAASPESKRVTVVPLTRVPQHLRIIDLGPASIDLLKYHIKKAKTVFWNGPLGYFEQSSARRGTSAIARALSKSKAFTVLGGGDMAYALKLCKLSPKDFSHVSTGGGAAIEFIEKGTLPGLEVLRIK